MTFSDKIVVIFLLIASAAAMVLGGIFLPKQEGKRVVITVDGDEYAIYDFSEIDGKKILEVKTEYGMNKIEITENFVKVVDADCPDKLDVLEGAISKTNEMIVCFPNRLMIEIKGGERKVDKVTY